MNESKPKLSRRLKVILGVSLALNLAVVGLFAGTALRHGAGGAPGGVRSAGFGAYGLPYMIAFPKEQRRRMIETVKSDRNAQMPNREARRALYNDVLSAIRAVPFDPDNLSVALNVQGDTAIRVQQTAQAAWLDVIAQMSDAERSAYAAAVEDVLRRGPGPRKK